MKRKSKPHFHSLPSQPVAVDRSQWSIESQRTYANFEAYRDIEFTCWACGATAVFSALDQKRYFEVKKAHIDKQRVFCGTCFKLSLDTASGIRACERDWKENRRMLAKDIRFLERWLGLMAQYKRFRPYRHNFAIEAMLRKLLAATPKQVP